MKVEITDLLNIFDKEIRKNCKNKRKVYAFEINKMEYISWIKYLLENNLYFPSKYNIFLIRDPKYRIVMSLQIKDKLVNHYVARHILIPKLDKYLNYRCVATRKGYGSNFGIKLILKYLEKNKNKRFYILKIDIKKYFYNIDHEILKNLLIDKLTTDEYKLVERIIDSTNMSYINLDIDNLVSNELNRRHYNSKKILDLPRYEYDKGLGLGAMSSQFLSIFYLYKLDHFIVNDLKLKYMVHYMDDYVIIHSDLTYLKKCLEIITLKLKNEYKLNVNLKKTTIIKDCDGFNFLGYTFFVKNKKVITKITSKGIKRVNRKIKKNKEKYNNSYINLRTYFSSFNTYFNIYNYGDIKNKYKIRRNL